MALDKATLLKAMTSDMTTDQVNDLKEDGSPLLALLVAMILILSVVVRVVFKVWGAITLLDATGSDGRTKLKPLDGYSRFQQALIAFTTLVHLYQYAPSFIVVISALLMGNTSLVQAVFMIWPIAIAFAAYLIASFAVLGTWDRDITPAEHATMRVGVIVSIVLDIIMALMAVAGLRVLGVLTKLFRDVTKEGAADPRVTARARPGA